MNPVREESNPTRPPGMPPMMPLCMSGMASVAANRRASAGGTFQSAGGSSDASQLAKLRLASLNAEVPCVAMQQAPAKRKADDGASQSVWGEPPRKKGGPRRCSQPWRFADGDTAEEQHVKIHAGHIQDALLNWWHQLSRNPSQSTDTQLVHLKQLFARRMKAPVQQDHWFNHPSQPVSDVYVLHKLQQVLQLRNEWLKSENIHDLNWQMPSGHGKGSRGAFLTYAKD